MPKKFTILSALATLSISTVGAVVPTFADNAISYRVSDVVPLHAPFARDMVAECGEYNNNNTYWNCFNSVTSRYRERHGGLFESMYQLDYNGRMIVTGLNPTAGTLRFYLDETKGFQDTAFTFENVVIFWADYYAANNPAWNESVGWDFVDNYLATGEVPQGYHVLYSGNRNDANWAVNTEVRVLYDQEVNKPEEVVYNNSYGFIHVYGYDTEGNRHLENNYPGACINGDLLNGGECRAEYTYNGSFANLNYVNGEAAPEDAMILELKQALKDKTEAQTALSDAQMALMDAQTELTEATTRAETAENIYRDLQARISELETAITNYQTAIREAETALSAANARADAAETRASQAETNAATANARADEAEVRASEAEARAAEIEAHANAELATAREAIENANRALEEARASEAAAIQAKEQAEELALKARAEVENAKKAVLEAEKTADEAKESAENAKKSLTEVEAKLKEANARLKDALARVETLEASPNTITIYKTIEKIVKDSSSETISKANLTTEINEQKSETEKTADDYVELPTAGKENEANFPWWLVVFAFTGIALILWWFIPNSRNRDE